MAKKNVMKFCLFLIVIAAIINLIAATDNIALASDATIKVEAEEYNSTNFEPGFYNNSTYSNGKNLVLYQSYIKGKAYTLDYIVNAPKTGYYELSAAASKTDVGFLSKYSYKANNGELISTLGATVTGPYSSPELPDCMNKYSFGAVKLQKGSNTISFVIPDERGDGLIIFLLDYFELKPVEWSLQSITSSAELGVFEQQQNVVYNIEGSFEAPENKTLEFVVSDYWSAPIVEGSIQIPAGKQSVPLNLGKLNTGWYRIRVMQNGTEKANRTFSVVPNFSERKAYEDTPFAADFAAIYLIQPDKYEAYSKAIELAGIKWVRDRYHWDIIEPAKNEYNFPSHDGVIDAINTTDLKLLEMFNDSAKWAKSDSGWLPGNLFDIYDFMKTSADNYDGRVDAWEIWNEEDAYWAPEAADVYASVLKAACIGLSDSKADPVKMFGGFATWPGLDPYPELLMQNGVLDYSDVYNFHHHVPNTGNDVQPATTDFLDAHTNLSFIHENENKPIWITENGMFMLLEDGRTTPTDEQLIQQARYCVTSTVEALSRGVTKYFWFVIGPYTEQGKELGSFYTSGMPFPVYSAESILTNVLGKGIYKGVVKNLPEGAYGYVINNGKDDVVVAWADKPTKLQLYTDKSVKIVDMMGGEKTQNACNCEKINVTLCYDPIYIVFDGETDDKNVYYSGYEQSAEPKTEFSEIERIILKQKFSSDADSDAKLDGYKINEGVTETVTIEVYNFNQTEKTGNITAEIAEGFNIIPAVQPVTVAPMSKSTVTFEISANDDVVTNTTHFLKFRGAFNGEFTSPSVSRINAVTAKKVEPDGIFSGANDPENWDVRNITGGAVAVASQAPDGEGVSFKCNFNGNDRWFYPYFKIDDTSVFEGKDGVCFWVYSENDVPEVGMNVFAYMDDGRNYFIGNVYRIQLKKGWRQICIPWSRFIVNKTPYLNDSRSIDPKHITHMSVGINIIIDDAPPYVIKDFGYYSEKGDDSEVVSTDEITIKGLTDGDKIYDGRISLSAVLPNDVNPLTAKVMLNDKIYDASVDGYTLNFSTEDIKSGKYRLTVFAFDNFGYAMKKSIEITVENLAPLY